MKFRVFALALLFANPAAAESIEAQYADAHRIFAGVEGNDPEAYFALSGQIMDGLEGRWTHADILARSGPDLDPEQLERGCGFLYYEIQRPNPYALDMVLHTRRGGAETTYTLSLVAGRLFHRSYDNADHLRRLGLDDPDRARPQMIFTTLMTGRRGPVILYRPSPDVLVIQPQNPQTELYARCPEE